MGNKCSNCIPQINAEQDHELSGSDFPNSKFAYPEFPKYQIPCEANHVVTNLSQLQIDSRIQKGVQLPYHYIIPYDGYYVGEWKYGKPHGFGEMILKNGLFFKGSFVNGVAKGHNCYFVMPDGSYYKGDIDKNKFQGYGIFKQANSHTYTGQWHDNVPNGKGKQVFQNGDFFEGSYINGKKEGLNCRYKWKSSEQFDQYNGGYRDDYFSGRGQLIKKNGTAIKGIFHGDDIYDAIVKNETYEYKGEVKEGKLHGKGKITFLKTKTVYEGQFKNGQIHGEGVMVNQRNEKKQGYWFKGTFLRQWKGYDDEDVEQIFKLISDGVKQNETLEDLLKMMNSKLKYGKAEKAEAGQRFDNMLVLEINKNLISIHS